MSPFFNFFTPSLKVHTALSTNPLVAEWYGADITYSTPFWHKKFLNFQLIKVDPLSDTTLCGKPNWTKIVLRRWMVACAVLVGIGWTFQPLGVCINYYQEHLAFERSHKMMWRRDHGRPGHFRGISGANGELGRQFWHSWQPLIFCSMSWSNPGFQTSILASLFIWVSPGKASCSSLSMSPWPALGMTTWFPQRMQISCTDNSSFLVANGLSYTSCTESGQPLCTNYLTREQRGSELVHTQIPSAAIGVVFNSLVKCYTCNMHVTCAEQEVTCV